MQIKITIIKNNSNKTEEGYKLEEDNKPEEKILKLGE